MDNILRPICTAWQSKIALAIKHREPWKLVADDCELFFAGAAGFMWEDKYRKRMGLGDYAPSFKMTIAKAFEFVALYGPSLYYRNPIRTVKPKDVIYAPDALLPLLGVMPGDQMSYDILMQQRQMEAARTGAVSNLVSTWLNYTPGEQAGGGLKYHSQLAVIDALVKGRGCLSVEPFQYPGSDRLITGAFYLSPNNVVIDPDASVIWDAKWIATKHTEPTWVLERRYGLESGSLKDVAGTATYGGVSELGQIYNSDGGKVCGSTFDSLTYWKVYSKGGIGSRLSGADQDPVIKLLDEQIGDYAYLIIPEKSNDQSSAFPLNVPTKVLESATPDELKQRLAWPIPYWKDGKWPVAFLDFYRQTSSTWPIAPLQPGLGELKFLNVMMSHLCNRIINSSRDFVLGPESMKDEINKLFKNGEDLMYFGVPQEYGNPKDLVSYLTQPQVNLDAWQIIDRVSQMFDKRVGLSELMYGYNPGAASRTAEDANMKRSALSVRPDHMAAQVEEWQTEVAVMEHICTQMFISPQDVVGRMGNEGAMLWQQLIMNTPIDTVLRETQVSIEAGTARKPNKDRDVANVGQAMQTFMPVLQGYMQMSGNPNPLNAMIAKWGDANDMDVNDMILPPPPPPMPPETQPKENKNGLPQV